jgi:hypothetical protein
MMIPNKWILFIVNRNIGNYMNIIYCYRLLINSNLFINV